MGPLSRAQRQNATLRQQHLLLSLLLSRLLTTQVFMLAGEGSNEEHCIGKAFGGPTMQRQRLEILFRLLSSWPPFQESNGCSWPSQKVMDIGHLMFSDNR